MIIARCLLILLQIRVSAVVSFPPSASFPTEGEVIFIFPSLDVSVKEVLLPPFAAELAWRDLLSSALVFC